jgi:two-component system chemotaxis sensor kinase CheA
MADTGDKARDEFFSEAQELIDGLGRDLLALDQVVRAGKTDPELVNEIFRAVHTLKGLSGLFGAALMTGLSHELEDVLDDLRLGRVELSQNVLDVVFRAVELYARMLAAERGDAPEPANEVKALLVALGELSQRGGGIAASPVAQYELDPGLLGVLTEYEEHRLRSNIQSGMSLYRLRVLFSLATIDSALDDLKARTRPHAEIITYLPTGEGGDAESIELEILVASRQTLEQLRAHFADAKVTVDEVKRRMELGPAPAMPHFGPEAGTSVARDSRAIPTPMPPPMQQQSLSIPPPGDAQRDLSLRSVSQTVRVDIRKLDHLMNIVGELAIVRSGLNALVDRIRTRSELRDMATDIDRLNRTFERHLGQLQNGILEVRMVPLGQAFDKLARVVRQLSRDSDKQVNFVVTGAETEIDKLIVEELSDPLMHMIRNAIDHGIEPREQRLAVGKPPVGTVALNAFQKGNQVVIEVEDDGRGMDPKHILQVAVRRNLIEPAEATEMSDVDALNLVFRPGFTTRDMASDISGRGVGMDIVKTNISKLGGIVDLSSEVGIGTKVTVTLPITLAIISVLMVEVAEGTYAVPLASVEEAIVFDPGLVRTFETREVLSQRGATLPICRLDKLFGQAPIRMNADSGPLSLRGVRLSDTKARQRDGRKFVVITQVGNRRLGLVVDRLFGQQDIVIKALGKSLKSVRGFAGATELGDQRVALVLDVAALVDEAFTIGERMKISSSSGGEARR